MYSCKDNMCHNAHKQKNNRYNGCQVRTFYFFEYSTNTKDTTMDLNPEQQRAVDCPDGPLLIIAGAGSGKTRTLTARLKRILEEGTAPSRVVAITFTNKAAEEMRRRVADAQEKSKKHSALGDPFIGTFHSYGARILRAEAEHFGRTNAFSIFDDDDSLSLLKKIAKAMKAEGGDPPSPARILKRAYAIKNNLLDIHEERDPEIREALVRYERLLEEQNAFDFGDLIEKPVRLLRKNLDVLKKYQGLTDHILVDEYQDVNPAQYELVKFLASGHRSLSVVGDDAQAIYGWRDAKVEHFLRFSEDWPDVKVIKLEQNYRSTKNVIEGAGAVVARNTFQHPKELWTENHVGELIRVVGAKNAEEEAGYIASTIRSIPKTFPSTAILYRTNAQSRALEQALIVENIPYRIFGGVKFYERKEVKDLLAALRVATNPRDLISRERLEKALPKKIARELSDTLPERAQTLGHLELISFFLNEANYFSMLRHEYPNAEERIENINELITFAAGFETLQEFLERASLLQSTDTPSKTLFASLPRGGAVRGGYTLAPISLMTIHMAKGLEFDRVFVACASEGILPHQMSYGSLAELEEERRLMYVAMTRARHALTLSFYRIPSRFLYEIPPELTEFESLSGMQESLPDDDIVFIDE